MTFDIEKRAAQRFTLNLPAEITCFPKRGTMVWKSTRTQDISASGAFLPIIGKYQKGASVVLLLMLVAPGSISKVRLSGVVKRVEAAGIGVAFDRMLNMESLQGLID